jgi:hypothetical protein
MEVKDLFRSGWRNTSRSRGPRDVAGARDARRRDNDPISGLACTPPGRLRSSSASVFSLRAAGWHTERERNLPTNLFRPTTYSPQLNLDLPM